MSDESFSRDKKLGLIAGFMRHAWEDLEESKSLAGRHSESFHAQQAAEKFMMAILTSEDVHFNTRANGHSLDARVDEIPDENPWKSPLKAITFLQNYATTSRYPRPSNGRVNRIAMADVARVRVARDRLETLMLQASKHFEVRLDFYLDDPAGNSDPYRKEGENPKNSPSA